MKPENVLLEITPNCKNPDAYIADFGFAIQLEGSEATKDVYGTPGYVDPSVIKGRPYTFTSDVFSIGSILYNIISTKSLFKGENTKATIQLNMRCEVEEKISLLKCSDNCKNLLLQMLCSDSLKRPTAS